MVYVKVMAKIDRKVDFMADDERLIGINEVDDRISDLISDMSESEKRELLKNMEVREQSKFEDYREHIRKSTSIYAVCSGPDFYFRDYIKDISSGGLFIETETSLFVNQEILITFFLPDAGAPLKIRGKVVRTDSKGIGVKFNEVIPNI